MKQTGVDMSQKVATVKLTVNLSEEVFQALESMARKNGVTRTEQLRRAISTEHWLEEVREEGNKILLEDTKGQIREVVFK